MVWKLDKVWFYTKSTTKRGENSQTYRTTFVCNSTCYKIDFGSHLTIEIGVFICWVVYEFLKWENDTFLKSKIMQLVWQLVLANGKILKNILCA